MIHWPVLRYCVFLVRLKLNLNEVFSFSVTTVLPPTTTADVCNDGDELVKFDSSHPYIFSVTEPSNGNSGLSGSGSELSNTNRIVVTAEKPFTFVSTEFYVKNAATVWLIIGLSDGSTVNTSQQVFSVSLI